MGSSADIQILRQGAPLPPPANINLQAGPLKMLFNPQDGFLRRICLGDVEVLNGLYVAVRNQNWDTVPPVLSKQVIRQAANGFEISFDVQCAQDDAQFQWRGKITGDAHGTIQYTMDGQALSSFKKNRIGFCVLHPMELAGSAVEVLHCDGGRLQGKFPAKISPHQPFKDLRSLTHEVWPGLKAEVLMEGEAFEMEDQRNWTDASYKTYCTPLGLPFPVLIENGHAIRQCVTLRLLGKTDLAEKHMEPCTISVQARHGTTLRMPPIGLAIPENYQTLSAKEKTLLQQLNIHHLRLDVKSNSSGAADSLAHGIKHAESLSAKVELALHMGNDPSAELRALLNLLQVNLDIWCSVIIYQQGQKTTPIETMITCSSMLRDAGLHCPIGGGTNAYFAEYNRNQPPFSAIDFSCFSINPQVHAFDILSLNETLAAQAVALASAKELSAGNPIHVSPVTLRPRFNPNATATVENTATDRLPPEVDVRQLSLFAAAWTLGSIKHLGESGAASLTYYEIIGWRGLMESSQGNPIPKLFPSKPGQIFPVYHIFRALADFKDGAIIPTASSKPLELQCLLLEKSGRRRLFFGNTSDRLQCLSIAWQHMPDSFELRQLDETNQGDWRNRPGDFWARPGQILQTQRMPVNLSLLPFATMILDFET